MYEGLRLIESNTLTPGASPFAHLAGRGKTKVGEARFMRFHLLDRITSCEPGQSLRGVKRLTLGEEYLHDHFPGFPIMPGVLQLQSLVEAASWLLRISDEFQHAVVVLREVKNVKYGNLRHPGEYHE